MTHSQLQEFIKVKKQKATPATLDWGAKRDAWLAALNTLFSKIEEYLRDTGVEVLRGKKPIWENYIGDYDAPEITLKVADESVLFSPKGLNVIGAHGRVDVFGDRDDATLVLQDADQWFIVAERVPKLKLIPLTADSFSNMLSDVMRS